MRLLRLSPEQVMQHWEYVKECLILALPPYVALDTSSVLRIQEQLLIGSLECWACVSDKNDEFYGILTTQITADEVTLTKNLLIFTVTLTEEHENDIWKDGYEYLKKYAISKECREIIAYTNQHSVVLLAKQLGGNTEWHLLKFSVS